MISPLKCSLLNILSNETVSMSYPFSFLRYQKNVLLTSNLDNWWCHKLKIYLESSSKAMTDRENWGEVGNVNSWVSKTKIAF